MPDLPAGYLAPLPDARPVGLRRRRVNAGTEIWRVDATEPAAWTWEGFPDLRYRFDPASGAFRPVIPPRPIIQLPIPGLPDSAVAP